MVHFDLLPRHHAPNRKPLRHSYGFRSMLPNLEPSFPEDSQLIAFVG
jgi:hypothetical protein